MKRSSSYSQNTRFLSGAHPRRGSAKRGYQLPSGRARAKRRRGAVYLHSNKPLGRRRGGYRASGSDNRMPYALIVVGCAFLFFVASIIWYANRSVGITVNGQDAQVRINSTISQYIEDNDLGDVYSAGDLLAVDDSVLERGGGDRYAVTLGGKSVPASDYDSIKFSGGEELTIDDGADVYEDHDVQATEIKPTLTVSGNGAIQYVKTWGVPGRSEVWTGHESGKTQDRGVVKDVVNAEVECASVVPDDGAKVVALTFDEGPSSCTQQILDILKEKGATATFFLSGEAVDADPSAAKAISDAGCEIGSNGYSDVTFSKLSSDDLRSQITQGFDAVKNATGESTALLRAPFAAFSSDNWCDAMDLVSAVVSWNVDSGDWLLPGADSIVTTVAGSVQTGNIVLLTDNDTAGPQTVEALPTLIDRLQGEGYKIVSLSDLVASDSELADAVNLKEVSMPKDAALPAMVAADEDVQTSEEG